MAMRTAGFLVALAVCAGAIGAAATGCELVAQVDRSLIDADAGVPAGGAGQGGSGASATQSGGGGAGGVAGTGGIGGTGGGCGSPADCEPPQEPCILPTCEGGVCGTMNAGAGHALDAALQIPMDCKTIICDGQGATSTIPDPNDVLDDSKQCTDDVCNGMTPQNTNAALGEMCSEGQGKVCDGAGSCVECNVKVDCAAMQNCSAGHICVPETCGDLIKNGDETDIDCGGSCGPTCDTDEICVDGGDCTSLVCTGLKCAAPTCSDAVKNGTETDTDCGGGCPNGCGPNQDCDVDADCTGGFCSGSVCVATCTDLVMNNGETDTDCGGANCPDCGEGDTCMSPTDCTSDGCCGAPMICNACCNAVKDGTETDIDCGGDDCPACVVGQACVDSQDCNATACVDGFCCDAACGGTCEACSAAKTGGTNGNCADIPANTDPDNECAAAADCNGLGACEAAQGAACTVAAECLSGFCVDGFCCNGQCNMLCKACSNAKNGGVNGTCGNVLNATDPDNECAGVTTCNGAGVCTQLPLGAACTLSGECALGNCVDGVCCNVACAGVCLACTAAKTGGIDGTCSQITAGTDPDNECNGATPNCDGAPIPMCL